MLLSLALSQYLLKLVPSFVVSTVAESASLAYFELVNDIFNFDLFVLGEVLLYFVSFPVNSSRQ